MNWYALRNAVLSLTAIAVVAAVATVVPVDGLGSARGAGWGRAVGASGVGAIHRGAGVRGSPRGVVDVAFSVDGAGRSARRVPAVVALTGMAPSPVAGFRLAAGSMAGAGLAPEPVVGGRLGPAGPFRPPVEPPMRVTRRFDGPARPWLPGHRGVDLASAPGATIWATGPGEVVFAGPVAGRSVVSIDHPGGLRTTYEPLIPVVHRGDHVAAGDPIGTLEPGHPDCPAAACLHWGLRRGDEYLDPLLLRGFRVRLLPL